MTTLDTLSLRFEAETDALFSDLDSLDARLQALADPHEMPLSLTQELETRLTVTADEAISQALSGAGERLSQAVEGHEAAFDRALAVYDPMAEYNSAQQCSDHYANIYALGSPYEPVLTVVYN